MSLPGQHAGPPEPRPPAPGSGPGTVDADGLLPDPAQLAELPVRQHIAVFETLHARLAEQLDEAD